ncbi:hypothetical protein [Treponema sp. OMZ 838]|uniref:hypothetical protein n=1 Tax=Treponema sp. OMZ 838 TaxID=1539298 RepID=UPI000AC1DB80|nr:hypothetical protein [Treponema sp. OMZ 838]
MKKSLLSFILFCLLIIAAGCKTAPANKTPEPAETAKGAGAETQTTQTAGELNTAQKAKSKEAAQTATAKTQEPVKTPGQANQTATSAAKNTQTKAPKQGTTQQKTANSNASATSAAKTDTSKQSVKTAPQKAPAKESTQKETPQKAAAQAESTSKNKTASQAKNAQTKPAKQDPKQQETAKSKATAKNNKQSASPEAAKKEASKSISAKQDTADKAAPAKQPENKKTETKAKESAAQTAAAQITDISWMIEQADASFVSKQHKGKGKIFVTMLAKYKGELTAQDFKEAFFASPADVWGLDEQSAKGLMEINKKEKLLMLKHLSSGEGEGAAALGKWFASVTLTGQKPFEKELNVTGIGGKTVTENKAAKEAAKKKVIPLIVPTAKAENEQQALTMPVIQSVSRDADTIEIIFSVNDSRVKNAYFYFDVPGEEYYRDSGSMIDATGKPVNGCRSFSTDGKKCQYVLRKDANNKDWFSKATQCFLVVSDVNRVASPWEERHRTISAASRIAK